MENGSEGTAAYVVCADDWRGRRGTQRAARSIPAELVNGDFETQLQPIEKKPEETDASAKPDNADVPGWYYGRHVKLVKEGSVSGDAVCPL